MSETMIERVAKAINPAPWSDLATERWPETAASGRAIALAQARAAIEAMRTPTDAMVAAAVARDDPGSSVFEEPYAACSHEEAWGAMIDEALKAAP